MSSYKVVSNTPANGDITFKARGYQPLVVNVNLQALENVRVDSVTPSNAEANVGESIVFVISGTSNNIHARVEPSDGVQVSQSSSNQYEITVTSTSDGAKQLVVYGDTIEDFVYPFTYLPADDIVITGDDNGQTVTKDKTITLTVSGTTKNVTASSSNANVRVAASSPRDPSCKEFLVTATNSGEATITVSGIGVNSATYNVRFRDADVIELSLIEPDGVRAGTNNTIMVTGADTSRTLIADSNNPVITTRVVSHEEIELSASGEGTATITVHGDYVETKEISVRFFDAVDTPTVTMTPANGQTKKGMKIRLDLTDTISRDITAAVSSATMSVSKVNPSDCKSWYVTSPSAVTGDVIFTSTSGDINEIRSRVEFLETFSGLPQFTVDQTEYSLKETDLPLKIQVKNVNVPLSIRDSNPLLFDVRLEENIVKISKRKPNESIGEDIALKVVISGEDQNDVVVTVNVKHVYIGPKPTMPCDGKTYRGFVDEEIYFNGPTVDNDDSLTIDAPSTIKTAIKDINRIYLNTNKQGPAGVYTIVVKHNDYKDGIVKYKCEERPTPPVVNPEAPDEWYDLGQAPTVTISTKDETFIKDVFESQQLNSDDERITYVLANGDGTLRNLANAFCTYNAKMSIKGVIPMESTGGSMNRLIYDHLLFIFNTSDYYKFRDYIRLVIKIMKHYRDTSFSTMLMMRFESGWVGTREELSQFRNIAAFLNKYIDANGQNVKVTGLEVVGDGYKNMERYCGENIQA